MHNVIIIGSGPAGLTAAIYTARANLSPLVFAGKEFGGQLTTTNLVENFPGYPEGIMGPQLMMAMSKQAEKYGAQILKSEIRTVNLKSVEKTVITDDGKKYTSKAVIIASGASPRRLGIPGEDKFYGRGVSTCATCDAAFYKDKIVAVVGGGDSAMEESIFITKFASKVYLIHRRNEFKASKIMQKRVFENKKIEILWNTEVKEILGDQKVSDLKLYNNDKNTEENLAVDGFFLAIGHIPNTNYLKGQIDLDIEGYINVVSGKTNTNLEGVFVAGDVYDNKYRQAVTAAGMGCMAAIDVEKWLK